MENIILLAFFYVFLLFLSAILRPFIFFFEPVFSGVNYLIYFLSNPFRSFQRNLSNNKARGFFLVFTITGLNLSYFIFYYVVTTPLRVITAIYYDVFLYLAIAFADSIDELLQPKRGEWRHIKGFKYVFRYVVTFPFRFVGFIFSNGVYVLDSFLMFGVSLLFPTITMKHGTSFNEAGSKIVQSGGWLVGQGNYAGTGIYFGMNEKTAEYYGNINSSHGGYACILARVTLTVTKTIATMKAEDRSTGLGHNGEMIAQKTKGVLTASVEHWRQDHGWWEYCLLRPNQMGEFVKSWRIRPVAILQGGKVVRTWGGFYHYSSSEGFVAGAISWVVLFYVFAVMVA